jgi:hypothetical protein
MSKYILVEALSQFRERYVVEVPDNHNDGEFPCTAEEWASDTVTMNEAKEFSQLWLGEVITSVRQIDKEEVLVMCDKDNDYAQIWSDEKKIEVFVTPIGYKRDQ